MNEYNYRYIKFFEDVRSNDVGLVGGKNSSLGELLSFGIPVPLGFSTKTNTSTATTRARLTRNRQSSNPPS